jgi:hypothetical protein
MRQALEVRDEKHHVCGVTVEGDIKFSLLDPPIVLSTQTLNTAKTSRNIWKATYALKTS